MQLDWPDEVNRLIPINDLVALTEPGSSYTVIGAGKTAMARAAGCSTAVWRLR